MSIALDNRIGGRGGDHPGLRVKARSNYSLDLRFPLQAAFVLIMFFKFCGFVVWPRDIDIWNNYSLIDAYRPGREHTAIILVIIIGIIGCFYTRRWQIALSFPIKFLDVTLMYAIICASIFWSIQKGVSYGAARWLCAEALAVILVVSWIDDIEYLGKLLLYALGWTMIASFLSVFISPDHAVHTVEQFAGLWRGPFYHKNLAGGIAIMCVGVSAVYVYRNESRIFASISLISSFIFLLFSESKTAINIMAIMPFIMIGLNPYKVPRHLFRYFLAVFLCLLALFPFVGAYYLYPVWGMDFTNRALIWSAVLNLWDRSQMLGFGTSAVFTGNTELLNHYADQVWILTVGHAHNGFVDVFSQLGYVGVAVVCFSLFRSISTLQLLMSGEWSEQTPGRKTALEAMFILIFVLLIRNCFEQGLLTNKSPWTVLLMIICAIYTEASKQKYSRYLVRT